MICQSAQQVGQMTKVEDCRQLPFEGAKLFTVFGRCRMICLYLSVSLTRQRQSSRQRDRSGVSSGGDSQLLTVLTVSPQSVSQLNMARRSLPQRYKAGLNSGRDSQLLTVIILGLA